MRNDRVGCGWRIKEAPSSLGDGVDPLGHRGQCTEWMFAIEDDTNRLCWDVTRPPRYHTYSFLITRTSCEIRRTARTLLKSATPSP